MCHLDLRSVMPTSIREPADELALLRDAGRMIEEVHSRRLAVVRASQAEYQTAQAVMDCARLQRNRALLALHEAGWTYAAIGHELGVSQSRAGALIAQARSAHS